MHESVSEMDLGALRKMFLTGSLQVWMPATQSFKDLSQQQRFRINPTYKEVLYQSQAKKLLWGSWLCVYAHGGLATLISLVWLAY